MNHPDWITTAAKEIVAGFRRLMEKMQNPNAVRPPPGAVSKEVADMIAKHVPKANVATVKTPAPPVVLPPPVDQPDPDKALSLDELYENPPGQDLIGRVLDAIKGKPLRIKEVAILLQEDPDKLRTALLESGKFHIAKAGWVRAA